jgi:hypothetical protein
MRVRVALLLILLVLLLITVGAGAQAGSRYLVEATTISGGGYHQTTIGAQASSVSTGGPYRLLGPAVPEGQGSGCCCTYLPCAMRNR